MTLSTPAVGRPSTAILLGLVALAPACGGDRPTAGPAEAVPTWTVLP